KDGPSPSESVGQLIHREHPVLSFPFGDPAPAGIETKTVSGCVCEPGADRRALLCSGIVDRFGEVGWEGASSIPAPAPLCGGLNLLTHLDAWLLLGYGRRTR